MGKILRQNRETANDHDLDAFLAKIGARVRKARAKRGMTRRILACDSGVSERYLAKLEAGTANPSAAVLRQLAHAMDYPIADFIPEAETMPAELTAVVDQLRTIGAGHMADVAAMLDANFDALATRAGRIALIGLRGAGKTTLGLRLSDALDVPFVELNRLIEADFGARFDDFAQFQLQIQGMSQLQIETILPKQVHSYLQMVYTLWKNLLCQKALHAFLA